MRIERAEVAWTGLRFETKSQSSLILMDWLSRLSTNLDFLKKITQTEKRKAYNLSKRLAINRCHEDMKFVISSWCIESHT